MLKSEDIDLKSYMVLLRRRMRLILSITAGFILLALVLNFVTRPIYEATARIEVRKEPNRSALTGEPIAADQWQSDDIAVYTAAELLSDRTLLHAVIMSLDARGLLPPGTASNPAPAGRPPGADSSTASPAIAADVNEQIDWLISIMTIKPVRETRLVNIVVEHTDPTTARRIADTVANTFVAFQTDQRAEADSNRQTGMVSRLALTRRQIETIENKLYGSGNVGIPGLEEQIKQITSTLASLNASRTQIQTDRLSDGARLTRIRQAMLDSVTASGRLPIQTDALDALRRDLLARQTDLAGARQIYRDKHPQILQLESEIQTIRENIRTELNKSIAALEQEYGVLREREKSLDAAIAEQEAALRDANRRYGQFALLQSELKSNRDLYDVLSTKTQESQISGVLGYPLVREVESATVGSTPVRPRKLLNLALGATVGLLGGIGAALLLEYLRPAIRTPEDVTAQLKLPVLGMIPKRS
jgi:succinoglycan biosynthesis transport protein ExoP